jgi:hypothetical protein
MKNHLRIITLKLKNCIENYTSCKNWWRSIRRMSTASLKRSKPPWSRQSFLWNIKANWNREAFSILLGKKYYYMQIFLGKRAFFNHGTAVSHLFVQLATIFSFQISNFALVFLNFLTSKHFGVCYMFNIFVTCSIYSIPYSSVLAKNVNLDNKLF